MKRTSCLALLALTSACATSAPSVAPSSTPATAAPVAKAEPPPAAPKPATVYRFEGLEVFGARHVPKEELLALYRDVLPPVGTELDMAQADGQAFIEGLGKVKQQLLSRYGFAMVRNSVTNMVAERTMRVTIDIVDKGDEWRMQYDAAPTGSVEEPEGLLSAWSAYYSRMWQLVNAKAISVEDTKPCRAFHCFYGPGHPELMKLEEPLLAGVPKHFETLAKMLREDKDPAKREKAAYLLAYGRSREEVAAALVPAMSDPHEAPRNAALRVLWVLQENADRPLVPLEKVLRAVHGPLISDRNKGAGLLMVYAQKDASQRVRILREAGEVLLEMAGAQQVIERKPALGTLRALAGKDLGDDVAAWRAWVKGVLAEDSKPTKPKA